MDILHKPNNDEALEAILTMPAGSAIRVLTPTHDWIATMGTKIINPELARIAKASLPSPLPDGARRTPRTGG